MFVLKQPIYWDQLHVKTFWVREMRKAFDFEFGPVTNPFSVCWLILEGNRRIQIGSTMVVVQPGDFVFFHTHTRYRLLPETEPCTTFHYLSIGCELMLDHIELPALHTIPTVFALSNQGQEELKNIWMSLLEAFTNASITITDPASPHHLPQAASFLLLRARTMEWLSLVFTFLKSNTFLEQQHDPRVTTICSFVQTNYPHTLTLSDLAKRVYVSSSYLSHLFVQSIGVAPMEYVRLTRMKKAKYFLIHTAASIREIAEETGYESQSHFSRAFRTFEGISPLQYRKRWRGY